MKLLDGLALLTLLLPIAGWSCNQRGSDRTPVAAVATNESHHDHAREASDKEVSDLDRPMEQLVGLTCEHHKKTYECDECRYETGFVRAPRSLMDGGLIATVKAEMQKVAVPLELTGEVRFDERRVGHLSSQVEGVIRKVYVALGDQVKKGDRLIELESVAVGEEQAVYREAAGIFALAQRNFERVSELRRENIASEKEFLQAKEELDRADIRATGALGKLARLGTGDTTGGRLLLRAPLDGAVLAMHAVSGELAKTDAPLITVGDSTAIVVWADLYERDIASVKTAQAAEKLAALVSSKAYPDITFPGTVELMSPAMDESSRTVKLKVAVHNADGRLLAGMFVAVKVFLPGRNEALVVPRAAVLTDEGRSFVFIHYQDDYYVRRPVEVGQRWAGLVELTDGIVAGQSVVTEGAFLMKSDVLRAKMGAGCAD